MADSSRIHLKALFDFEARVPNELTFKEGDIIILIDKHESGMWKGELSGQIGLFPYNFVGEIKDGDTGGAGGPADTTPGITEGWLTKQGHIRKNWKRRWFVLRGTTLYYYAKKEDKKEKGFIQLPGYIMENANDVTGKLHSFHLLNPSNPKKKQFYIHADNALDLQGWTKTIEAAAKQ
ncbi:putative connector enhancer of kinase suppressor of Ras 2 [Monocercomonoides exilis]|uniref:putative connector enhancer of kinase suppressor of Ras 2 n=1 Tax=Monocercomonoides exilis TaxID=2049356 RepID=UPI00355A02BF|nr:putative connector enhancer of kinase suppressor of Ras 2 [Monocercomonoides exilis]